MSLVPVDEDFDANNWCEKLQELSVDLKDLNDQLEIAINNYNSLLQFFKNSCLKKKQKKLFKLYAEILIIYNFIMDNCVLNSGDYLGKICP